MASETNSWEQATANVEPLDDPYEKSREAEQMLFMKRIPKAALASIISSWIYFLYSFKCLLDAQAAVYQLANQSDESIVPTGPTHLLAFLALGKEKRQPLLRLVGDICPTVDVFVAYCGEELEVLLGTARAAAALDYPKHRYRVIVLDDSVSSSVETEIRHLQCVSQNVFYTTRGSKPKTHTKAGNLNHGLKYVSDLPGGPSQLVAVLDVDMIPSRHWLRALVPHILTDPGVAMANPPQRQYNIPDGDPLGQSLDILFDMIEPLKNATNSAWCCGTGFVVRRDALDGIGGIPEESMNEDVLTSFYLAAAGWRIVYVHEDVQWGLVPSTITSHLKQAKRWCAGIISCAAVFYSPQARNMTLQEKYGVLFPAIAMAMTITFNMAIMVGLPLLLLSGAPLVAYSTESQLRAVSVLFLVKFLAIFSFDFLAAKATNYHLSLMFSAGPWTVPFQFMTIVQFAISVFSARGAPLFTPSGLVDIQTAKTFASRIKVALWDNSFIVHVVISMSLVAGIVASANAAIQTNNVQGLWKDLLVRAAWPPIFQMWSAYILSCWTPISYTLNPPTPPSRNSSVDRDPKTQLAYPNRHAKDQFPPEAEVWYNIPEFNLLERNITVPGFSPLFPDAHCTENGDVCQLVTGESEINAATTLTALTFSPLFDLRKTYFLIAGIAGISPKLATLGSVTFARYAIQVALQYELDARSIPENFTTGYIPQGSVFPNEYSQSIYGTEVFELNNPLRQLAIAFARTATLNDSATAISYRVNYASSLAYMPGSQPPSVLGCDVATSDTFFSGTLLSEAFENTTRLFTNGSGVYCTTAQEDNATLEALLRGAINNRTDFSRIIIMRTASDFDRPFAEEPDTVNLFYADQGGFEPAVRNIYLAGVKVVQGVLGQWEGTFEEGVKPDNYIGDIFGSLGGVPDFGPGSEFGDDPVFSGRKRRRRWWRRRV
ncbi:MAG: hypothetical protein Q9188_001609 [Gyalolechia gomerana]